MLATVGTTIRTYAPHIVTSTPNHNIAGQLPTCALKHGKVDVDIAHHARRIYIAALWHLANALAPNRLLQHLGQNTLMRPIHGSL